MLPRSQEQALAFALKLRSSRSNWDSLFERLAEMFLPNRVGFTSQRTDGEELFDHLNSSAPVLARRGLSSAVSTMLRPAGRMWFKGKSKMFMLNADPNVRLWCQQVTETMFAYMYDPRAKMEVNLAMCDDDLVTFGNGCVRVGWDRVKKHLRFRTRSMAGVYYVADASGNVIGLVSFEQWTLRQIIERFGEDALSEGMRAKLQGDKKDLDSEWELVNIVIPVMDAKALGLKFRQPYSSLWMSVKCKKALDANGFDYFPYLCPQWDKATGEVYARSPAMVALGSSALYQAMTETMVDAGEKVLNPPVWGYGDAINGQLDLSAGGFTPVEISGIQSGQAPINPLQLGTLPAQIFEFMQQVNQEIGAAFYRDILELPSARDKDLTATEINARLDQYMRQAAPVFGRIEHNYNAPLVNTVYRILQAEGVLPPKPDIVQEVEMMAGEDSLEFEYESPIKVARDKAEAMKVMEGLQMIAGASAGFGPDAQVMVAENFNPDAFARYMAAKLDIPEILMSPMEDMMQARQARMQAQQQMQMAEMAGRAGPGMAAMGRLIPESAKAGLISSEGSELAALPAPDMIPFEDVEGLAEVL